jgi:hypothetical protein
MIAFIPDAHTLLMVVQIVEVGKPANEGLSTLLNVEQRIEKLRDEKQTIFEYTLPAKMAACRAGACPPAA